VCVFMCLCVYVYVFMCACFAKKRLKQRLTSAGGLHELVESRNLKESLCMLYWEELNQI